MITLYYFYLGCSMASHIALEESGLEYEAQPVDFSDPEQKEALLRLNPKGKVPTAVFDGKVLTENLAILWHVTSLAPDAGLVPDDPMLRAQCLSMLGWFSSTVHISFRQGIRPDKIASDPVAHDSIKATGRRDYFSALELINDRYRENEFIMGDRFSVADTYTIVFYNWALYDEYPVHTLEHYTKFKNRIIQRPSVRAVLDREGCTLLDV